MVKNTSSAILTLIVTLGVLNVFSQSNDTSVTNGNLYARALSACVAKEAMELGDLGTGQVDYSNRIVQRDIHLTDKLPTQFGAIKVEYLDAGALLERYRKTRKDIQMLSIRPMRNEGSTLIVSTGNYWFSYKKKSYNYALEGGCTVKFNFDTEQDNFAIAKIDLWGI